MLLQLQQDTGSREILCIELRFPGFTEFLIHLGKTPLPLREHKYLETGKLYVVYRQIDWKKFLLGPEMKLVT